MKIGIDASRANRSQKTGVEWYAWHVIQEFKKIIPPTVEVVLYSDTPLTGDLAILPANWKSKILVWPPKFLWTHFRLSVELLLHKPNIYFIPAHVIPFLSRGKAVVAIHDVAYKVFPRAYTRKGRFYLNLTTWWQKMFVKKIITISEVSKNDIIKYYHVPQNKIAVIPIAYDAKCYQLINDEQKTSAVLAKYGVTKPFIMSISRLEYKKNTHGIINAFSQLPDRNSQLLLVGKPGRGYQYIQNALDSSPAKDHIILPGWIKEEDVPYLMNAASAFVFPSFYEGFGIPILEAMACGCSVITSNTTACPEVAGNAAILVDPQNTEQITEAINKILTDRTLAEELKNRGLERVKNFSWSKTAEATWKEIEKL
ncbi:MAG: glycosyltransferase family 1 protein [Patescibacteria group bacterium]|jgi:glycosyltransferase involved in cell wall biosynthesis